MSYNFLKSLLSDEARTNNPEYEKECRNYIAQFGEKEISLAWYPSAGFDFRSLADIYVQTKIWGIKQPDLFICTDCHAGNYRLGSKNPEHNIPDYTKEGFLFSYHVNHPFEKPADSLTQHDRFKFRSYDKPKVITNCYVRERLWGIQSTCHSFLGERHPSSKIVHLGSWPDDPLPNRYRGYTMFYKFTFSNHPHLSEKVSIPVIYISGLNEEIASEMLLRNEANIDLIYHRGYMNDSTYTKYARGNWLVNVLWRLHCKTYIKVDDFEWAEGDYEAIRQYPNLAAGHDVVDLSKTPQLNLDQYGVPILERVGDVYLINQLL